jgi:peptide-methionine (S)-S-oxide reductase
MNIQGDFMDDHHKPDNQATAIFAGGCFWGIEDAFRKIPGVIDAISGYAGGHTENPTYEEVGNGTTGHAESVQVIYDPQKVTYDDLLKTFWANHNPTTKNRQGPDIGEQYRSVIFYTSPEQKKAAEASKNDLSKSGTYHQPIVTEVVPAGPFYKAEEYHQHYFEKHGISACHI